MIHPYSKAAHKELTSDRHAAVLEIYRQHGPLTDRQVATILGGEHADCKRPAARVTQEQVLAIRDAHSHGTPQVALAKAYGIGPQAINAIIKRRSWQWI